MALLNQDLMLFAAREGILSEENKKKHREKSSHAQESSP
jgi:hypothetical protein